jgi:hypothetical protein
MRGQQRKGQDFGFGILEFGLGVGVKGKDSFKLQVASDKLKG